ncbi:hypothetical protein [Limosilactobacillus caviae]|uniref:hypothetical protein n=1 Tax=Limosilactobacillus caviae TaxID=1769424 RepID=UPI003518B07E
MRITIDGSPEEIKNLLDAIGGSKEQNSIKPIYDDAEISERLQKAISRLDLSVRTFEELK